MLPPYPVGLNHYRARLYRTVLLLAAAYNAAFGLWAGFWPQSFFNLVGLQPPLYPAIWRCLGMVVGVYALAYAYAALRLDLARPFVAIGLLGKILGPLGLLFTIASGEWPARTLTLIVFNDLIWWLPFSLFLLEGTRLGARLRALAPFACALLNGLAGVALLLFLQPGTEAGGPLANRAAYIGSHLTAWRAGWFLWMLAALSLVAFYAWWGARLPRLTPALLALGLVTAGLLCDLFSESLFIGWYPNSLAAFHRPTSLLTGGAANGLYTLAGITLTLATPWLRGLLRVWAWAAWLAGLALTATTLLNLVPGMIISAGLLMPLFVTWTAVFGWQTLRRAPSALASQETT